MQTEVPVGTVECFEMMLTSQRVMFVRPQGSFARQWLRALLWRVDRYAPAFRQRVIALTEVKRVWKWQPEFSGPPALELHVDPHARLKISELIPFRLLEGAFPRSLHSAPLAAVRRHCEDVERAVAAAHGAVDTAPTR